MTLEPDHAADSRGATSPPPAPGKGGDDIVIVLATQEHAQPLRACLDSVSRERRFLIADEAPPVDAIRDNLKVQIDGGGVMMVACAGNAVVGWCSLQRNRLPANRHRAWLGMGVVGSHRGRGIGPRLLQASIDEATARDIARIDLEVRVDNDRARRLYERFGFRMRGRVERALRVDDAFVDTWAMVLLLDGRTEVASPGAV